MHTLLMQTYTRAPSLLTADTDQFPLALKLPNANDPADAVWPAGYPIVYIFMYICKYYKCIFIGTLLCILYIFI